MQAEIDWLNRELADVTPGASSAWRGIFQRATSGWKLSGPGAGASPVARAALRVIGVASAALPGAQRQVSVCPRITDKSVEFECQTGMEGAVTVAAFIGEPSAVVRFRTNSRVSR